MLPAFFLLIIISACATASASKKNFFSEPKAVRDSDYVEVTFGAASASDWIAPPPVKIEGDVIYIKGTFATEGVSMTISIRVPDHLKRYRVIWIDKDGNESEIQVH